MSDQETNSALLLSRLSNGLRGLHKALVEFSSRDYESKHGTVEGPAHLLQLLTTEPYFSWLHVLSELMIDIDQVRDQGSLTNAYLKEIRLQVEALIGAAEPSGTEFGTQYADALQRSVSVVMAHADVRKALSTFP